MPLRSLAVLAVAVTITLGSGCNLLSGAGSSGATPMKHPGVDPTVASRNDHAADNLPPDGKVPSAAQLAQLDVVWAREINLRRHSLTEFTPEEQALYCRNNLRVARALALAYPEDTNRGFALRVEIVLRFNHPYFADCATREADWKPFADLMKTTVLASAAIPDAGWPKLAKCKQPFVLMFDVDVNSEGVQGREVVGRSRTVEGYDVKDGIAGKRLEARVRDRDVVADREDRLAVFTADQPVDLPPGKAQNSTIVVARCAGKTTTTLINLPKKKLAALSLRAIAIGSPDRWEWTAWGTGPAR